MPISAFMEYVTAGKSLLDLYKSAADLLPKGEKKDEISRKLVEAEALLKRSDAKLAKDLGYELCKCTYPPQIMLWSQSEYAHTCPRKECGRREKRWNPADDPPDNSTNGPDSWLAR